MEREIRDEVFSRNHVEPELPSVDHGERRIGLDGCEAKLELKTKKALTKGNNSRQFEYLPSLTFFPFLGMSNGCLRLSKKYLSSSRLTICKTHQTGKKQHFKWI